ncbi:MAG: hypothetical protein AAGA86_11590 [Bacteroidota bacterium]
MEIKAQENGIGALKIGVWVFFLLLIFEGAFRKWFLPGLSAPLLIIRDPLILYLLVMAWKKNILPKSKYLMAIMAIGILALATTLLFGHGNVPVALFGARILVLHFPFMFVIGAVFGEKDIVLLGKILLWLSIPMVLLLALQFYSPQSAWVNRGVGGDLSGAGFSGALGYFRPPGTFSFTTGTSQFFGLLACFVLYFWVRSESVNRLLLVGASLALLAAIPLSISRTLLFSVILMVLFAVIAMLGKPKYTRRIVIAGLCVLILLAILAQMEFFQTSIEVFTARAENAGRSEGGLQGTLINRYLGGMIDTFDNSTKLPFFGYGIGMGTNVGSQILAGERTFLIAEEEWGRLVGEMGLLLGITVILIRVSFSLHLFLCSLAKLKNHIFLPWMLVAFGLLLIPYGQWAQPTTLGFSILVGGLILASLKEQELPEHNPR